MACTFLNLFGLGWLCTVLDLGPVSQKWRSTYLKLNATVVIQTRIHVDVTFQDGGGKAPQAY